MFGFILAASLASSFVGVEMVRNYDGDTFVVNLKDIPEVFGYNISVRIRGIDSAEIKGNELCEKYDAIESRDVLYKLLDGKKIKLLNCSRDKYFRLLCDVNAGGIDIKSYMLDHKYAVSYDGATKKSWHCKRVMPAK
jgi:endonuclease YncB( thermonuclease family)